MDNFIILGSSSLPMLHSSTSGLVDSILGFLATSLKSNISSKGASPLGNILSLHCNTSRSLFYGLQTILPQEGVLEDLYQHHKAILFCVFVPQQGSPLRDLSLVLAFQIHFRTVGSLKYVFHLQILANNLCY